jgi:hypothetical protein
VPFPGKENMFVVVGIDKYIRIYDYGFLINEKLKREGGCIVNSIEL